MEVVADPVCIVSMIKEGNGAFPFGVCTRLAITETEINDRVCPRFV